MNKDWTQIIIDWADENNIPDLIWIENALYPTGGYWGGLPRDVDKLLNLEQLYFENLDLDYLPDELANLTNLKGLLISNTNINTIPNSFSHFKNLVGFTVDASPISDLPNDFFNLKLQYFGILRTNITRFPEEIVNLKLKKCILEGSPNLILTSKQINWLRNLEDNAKKFPTHGYYISYDNNLIEISELYNKLYNIFKNNRGLKEAVGSAFGLGYMGSSPILVEAYELVSQLALLKGDDPTYFLYTYTGKTFPD